MKNVNIMLAGILLVVLTYLTYSGEWYAVLTLLAASVFIVLRRIRSGLLK